MKLARRPRRELRSPHPGGRTRGEPDSGGAFRAVAVAVTGVALLAGLIVGPQLGAEILRLSRSRPFQVRSVAVVGARRLSPAQVVAVSGLSAGSALLDVDVDVLARRVATLPAVASARALRLPPNRVVIGVRERVARGVNLADDDGTPQLVCDEGVTFAEASSREALGLPRLSVPGPHAPHEAAAGLALAARTAAAAEASGFAVAGVRVGDDGAVLRLRNLPAEVLLGPAPHDEALARLVQLVGRRPDLVEGASRIDVRFADQAVLRSEHAPEGAQKEAPARGSARASKRSAAGVSAVDRGGETWHARTI